MAYYIREQSCLQSFRYHYDRMTPVDSGGYYRAYCGYHGDPPGDLEYWKSRQVFRALAKSNPPYTVPQSIELPNGPGSERAGALFRIRHPYGLDPDELAPGQPWMYEPDKWIVCVNGRTPGTGESTEVMLYVWSVVGGSFEQLDSSHIRKKNGRYSIWGKFWNGWNYRTGDADGRCVYFLVVNGPQAAGNLVIDSFTFAPEYVVWHSSDSSILSCHQPEILLDPFRQWYERDEGMVSYLSPPAPPGPTDPSEIYLRADYAYQMGEGYAGPERCYDHEEFRAENYSPVVPNLPSVMRIMTMVPDYPELDRGEDDPWRIPRSLTTEDWHYKYFMGGGKSLELDLEWAWPFDRWRLLLTYRQSGNAVWSFAGMQRNKHRDWFTPEGEYWRYTYGFMEPLRLWPPPEGQLIRVLPVAPASARR